MNDPRPPASPPEEPDRVESFADEPPAAPAPPAELAPGQEPVPAEPTPAEPTPAPAEQAPELVTEPSPAEPAPEPVQPEPVQPEPVQPEPVQPASTRVEPVDAEAAPAGSTRGETAPVVPPATARSRGWLPVAAVATAVAVLAALTGLLSWQLYDRHADREQRVERLTLADAAGEQAREAAGAAAGVIFSYNHTRLAQDFEKGLALTTGDFREEYSRTTKEVVTPVAEQYDAVVVAEVIETAVLEAEPDQVRVLVFLNQATTSTRVQGQKVDQSRVRMHMVEQDGSWLVEAVQAL